MTIKIKNQADNQQFRILKCKVRACSEKSILGQYVKFLEFDIFINLCKLVICKFDKF